MPEFDVVQVISLAGALLILGAFSANQIGLVSTHQVTYNLVNLVGALILAWVAVISAQWGFILLEGAWAAISLVALVRQGVSSRADQPHGREGSSTQ